MAAIQQHPAATRTIRVAACAAAALIVLASCGPRGFRAKADAHREACYDILDDYQRALDAAGGDKGTAVDNMRAITETSPTAAEPSLEYLDQQGCPAKYMRAVFDDWPERRPYLASSSALSTLTASAGSAVPLPACAALLDDVLAARGGTRPETAEAIIVLLDSEPEDPEAAEAMRRSGCDPEAMRQSASAWALTGIGADAIISRLDAPGQ